MKASELRIGNWLFEEDFNQFQLTLDWIKCLDFEKCNPIPLTEEWLMKFGFKKKVDYEQSEDEWGIISSINSRRGVGLYQPDEYKEKSPNYFFVSFREDVGCGWNDLNEVEYVHQLQNLYFALTGEELTIK